MGPEILSQLPASAAIGLGVLALASGAGLARLSAPLACSWPARGQAMLRRLNAVKSYRPIGMARAALGGALVAALLGAGTLAAYAAEPSAPDRLPSQAVGVVGSGDRLSLRIWAGGQGRSVAVGEDYEDGWKLQALTPSAATLSKGAERRQVGLNPTGLVPSAQPPASPSAIAVTLGGENLAALQRLIDRGGWDGVTADPGMTFDETRRYRAYSARGGEALMAALASSGGRPIQPTAAQAHGDLTEAEEADRAALLRVHNAGEYQAALARGDVNQARIYDGLAVLGPESFHVPAGTSLDQAAQDAGLLNAIGYILGPLDATGGRTMTKAPASGRVLDRTGAP